jgi:hypothetical protein
VKRPFREHYHKKNDNLTDFPTLYAERLHLNHRITTFYYDSEINDEVVVETPGSSFSYFLHEILLKEFEIRIDWSAKNPGIYLPDIVDIALLKKSLPDFNGLNTALSKLVFIKTLRVAQVPFYLQEYSLDNLAGMVTFFSNNHQMYTTLYPFIRYWAREFEIGEEITIHTTSGGSQIMVKRGDYSFNGNDIGFGSLQLISLIFSIALNPDKIFVIEEPEINLHPKIQSRLADFFIDCAHKFDCQFIIESHSEYLIRKMQYWVARRELKTDEIIIHYLQDPIMNKNENQVATITINEDGSLDGGFGPGFFDEATNIQFELFKLNKQQSN